MNWRDALNRLAWMRRNTGDGRVVPMTALNVGLSPPPRLNVGEQHAADARWERLLHDFPAILSWPADLPEMIRHESLARLSLLHDHLPAEVVGSRWLDVGSKNAAAAFGIATMAAQRSHVPLQLDLAELDAGRRYRGGLRRIDHGVTLADAATHWLGDAHQVRYVAGDVRVLEGSYDVIIWCLPFLFPEPHQAWGLPLSLLDPPGMLAAVADRLAPGGHLLIMNLNAVEAEKQRRLLRETTLDYLTEYTARLYWLHPERQLPGHLLRRHS